MIPVQILLLSRVQSVIDIDLNAKQADCVGYMDPSSVYEVQQEQAIANKTCLFLYTKSNGGKEGVS